MNNPVDDSGETLRDQIADAAALRVLVVDDTEGNRYAVSHLLRSVGMEVMEASNGRQALELVTTAPDLVILDINLPDISGREVLKEIRSNPEIAWLPVMHLSASFTASEDQALGLDLGADAYQTHPIDPTVFLATTRALLRLSRAEAKIRRASQEWRAAFDSLSDAIFIAGMQHPFMVQRCNIPAARLVGRAPRDVVGMGWTDILEAIGADADDDTFGTESSSTNEAKDVRLKNRWYSVNMLASTFTGNDGFRVCVMQDITERKEAEKERERLIESANAARTEAETASRVKGEFLAVMSHELRTPLNAIGGYVDLLAMGIRGPLTEEQSADLERIKRSQKSLTILINDVLNFAKAESGELAYNFATFAVSTALDRASEVIEYQLEHTGLTFLRRDGDPSLLVHADADKVQQVILNLLSNAIKFTRPGGSITLASGASDDAILISVSDTGMGVPEDMRDAIFQPFVQAHPGRTREQSGVGLGLSISRDLARGMGGDLSIQDSSSGGSTFVLQLPRREAVA